MTTNTRKYRQPSPEAQERRAAFVAMAKRLDGELKAGQHKPTLAKAKAEVQGLERYSELNQLLIVTQCPGVTEVHGYKEWQGLGFQVRKGEKAIAIRAPHTRPGGDGEDAKAVGFHRAYVFDKSQVDPISNPTPEEEAYVRSLGEDDDFE